MWIIGIEAGAARARARDLTAVIAAAPGEASRRSLRSRDGAPALIAPVPCARRCALSPPTTACYIYMCVRRAGVTRFFGRDCARYGVYTAGVCVCVYDCEVVAEHSTPRKAGRGSCRGGATTTVAVLSPANAMWAKWTARVKESSG